MRSLQASRFRRCLVPMLVALAALTPAAGEWNTAGSPAFTYCLAAVNCEPGDTLCVESDLGIASDCNALCGVQPFEGEPFCIGVTDAIAETDWRILASGNQETLGSFLLAAQGTLETPDLFSISGTRNQSGAGEIEIEISVFRYAGDPTAFDGLRLATVYDLVDLGLVALDDVLLAADMVAGEPEDFDYNVDVTGVPADQIVLLGIGRDVFGPPVPALGAWGSVFLGLLLLGCFTFALRRRASSA